MAMSLEESKKRSRLIIFKKYLSFGAKIAKIGPVDAEIVMGIGSYVTDRNVTT